MRNACLLAWCVFLAMLSNAMAFIVPSPAFHRRTCVQLQMGLLDNISSFLQDRQGDFVKLEDSESATGPGPLLVLYNLPETIAARIEDDEYLDMIGDGAPKATASGVVLARISRNDASLLDMTLSDALEKIVREKGVVAASGDEEEASVDGSVVLLFSGFDNKEMMATYNIVGREMYEESGGSVNPACAKAVPNAMTKPLRQVLEEIAGDHEEAMSSE